MRILWTFSPDTGCRTQLPDGCSYIIFGAPSDRRALQSAAHEIATLGIDLRRPTR